MIHILCLFWFSVRSIFTFCIFTFCIWISKQLRFICCLWISNEYWFTCTYRKSSTCEMRIACDIWISLLHLLLLYWVSNGLRIAFIYRISNISDSHISSGFRQYYRFSMFSFPGYKGSRSSLGLQQTCSSYIDSGFQSRSNWYAIYLGFKILMIRVLILGFKPSTAHIVVQGFLGIKIRK